MAELKGGSTVGGNEIWHKGNQGVNSGLDADRLKGKNWSVQNTAPTSPQIDDVWVDTKELLIKVWNGSIWAVYSGDFTGLETTVSVDAKLSDKVDKVEGKDLSTNDYTTAEKTKLAGIATNANNYVHPANHPASMIIEDAQRRFVTDADKTNWNAKIANSEKGVANGVAKLNADGKVIDAQNNDIEATLNQIISAHSNDAVKHITGAERARWDGIDRSMMYGGTINSQNWDDLANGHYDVVSLQGVGAPTSPYGYGKLVVFSIGSSRTQIYFPHSVNPSNTVMMVRNGGWNSPYKPWFRILTQNDYDTLFNSVSNGKSLVANAITQRGVSTSTTAEFATMANNIANIQTDFVRGIVKGVLTSSKTNVTITNIPFKPRFVYMYGGGSGISCEHFYAQDFELRKSTTFFYGVPDWTGSGQWTRVGGSNPTIGSNSYSITFASKYLDFDYLYVIYR